MKRLAPKILFFILSLSLVLVGTGLLNNKSVQAYSNNDMIDDSVFDNSSSMSAIQIQNFLNQFPNSCIKNYLAPDPQGWSNYGSLVSAAQVIKDASSIWGINPQVLITTMEKEEGLVRGDGRYGCSNTSFWSAMGYNCPGSATYTYSAAQLSASSTYSGGLPGDMSGGAGPTCAAQAQNVGFSAQVSHGAWQLEFGRQRSEGNGNLSWDGDNSVTYFGYMTAGTRARVQGGSTATYSGVVTLNDGNTVTLDNGATASLYSYTPYIQSFDPIFEGFFGAGSTSAHAYSATYHSQSSSPVVNPGTTATGWIEYTNSGNAAWYDDSSIGSAPTGSYPVHLATAEPINRASPFGATWGAGDNRAALTFAAVYNSDGSTLATNQHVAQPGQIVKFGFTFTIGATQTPGQYQENFQPVAEGTPTGSFADPGTFLDVTVNSVYSSAYSSEGSSPNLRPGQSATSSISYQNTGNTVWYDNMGLSQAAPGTLPIHLATSHPLNRVSSFGGTWDNGNRPAYNFSAVYQSDGVTLAPNQHVVLPGQIAQFSFTLTAPTQQAVGSSQEYFQPIQEGGSTMNDPGTYLTPSIISAPVGANTDGAQTLSFPPNGSQTITLHFTNVGNTTWTTSTTHLLANPSSSASSFHDSSWTSSTVVGNLNEPSVAPGAVGSFTVILDAPLSSGSYYLEFAPSGDTTFFGDPPAQLTATVSPPSYNAAYVTQSAYPTLVGGQQTTGFFEYKNNGNVPWYDDTSIGGAPAGAHPVHLATSQPINRSSLFSAGWSSTNRPSQTFAAVYLADGVTLASNQHIVQPGQIAKFSFTLTAPLSLASGTYQENFMPVAEGTPTGAFNNPGTYLNLTVQQATFSATYAGQSAYPTLSNTQTASAFVKYKNSGTATWYDDSSISGAPPGNFPVHLAAIDPINRASLFGATWGADRNRPALTFAKVYLADGTTLASNQHVATPGEIVEFDFTFTDSAVPPGLYHEHIGPVAEGSATGLFADPGTWLDVTAQ